MRKSGFFVLLILLLNLTSLKARQTVFNKGDKLVGARLALGSVFGSNSGIILNGEYGLKDNPLKLQGVPNMLGLGLSLSYSSYIFQNSYGNYEYSNYLVSAALIWHLDIFKRPNIDTYSSFNLGLNTDTSTRPNKAPARSNSYSGLMWGLALGGRYAFSPQLSAIAEIGYGMGLLRLGLDYKF